MGASVGKPYCVKGRKYLKSNRHLSKTCKECEHIRYIGCPGWKQKFTRNPMDRSDLRTRWWIGWWYHNEPVPDDYHEKGKLRPAIDNTIKPLCHPEPDCEQCESDIDCGGQEKRPSKQDINNMHKYGLK